MWVRKYKNTQRDNKENYTLYNTWCGMKRRCFNQNYSRYKDYGGRGITICEEWLDFDNFVDWAKENGFEIGLTIERIDNDGNYEPSNCAWITRAEQNRNRRSNKYIEYQGETKTLAEWCEKLGLKYGRVQERLASGWSVEDAFTQPPPDKSKESFTQLCKRYNINRLTVYSRVHDFGWDLETALTTPPRKRKEVSAS